MMNRRAKRTTPVKQTKLVRLKRAVAQASKPKQAKRVCKGDTVVVISGNERGKKGTVERRLDENRLVIQGVNLRKKAVKPSEANPQGGFLELEGPIHASNVMLCNEDGKGFRAKARIGDEGKEIYGTINGAEIKHRSFKGTK